MGRLLEILGRPKYLAAALTSAALFFALLAFTSNTILLGHWELNPFVEPALVAMNGLIAVLFGANIGVLLHNADMREAAAGGALGAFVALFTSACPVCQPIWLVWLGFGSATAFLAEFGRYISVLSIAMLAVSLHHSLKTVSGTCEVMMDGKNA